MDQRRIEQDEYGLFIKYMSGIYRPEKSGYYFLDKFEKEDYKNISRFKKITSESKTRLKKDDIVTINLEKKFHCFISSKIDRKTIKEIWNYHGNYEKEMKCFSPPNEVSMMGPLLIKNFLEMKMLRNELIRIKEKDRQFPNEEVVYSAKESFIDFVEI